MNVLMECGHVAQAKDQHGNPVCVICIGIDKGATRIVQTKPDLTGRKAKCAYGHNEVASNYDLPFFEYKGVGSFESLQRCKNCNFFRVAHTNEIRRIRNPTVCNNFEPHGPFEFDTYYDGCRGWD